MTMRTLNSIEPSEINERAQNRSPKELYLAIKYKSNEQAPTLEVKFNRKLKKRS